MRLLGFVAVLGFLVSYFLVIHDGYNSGHDDGMNAAITEMKRQAGSARH